MRDPSEKRNEIRVLFTLLSFLPPETSPTDFSPKMLLDFVNLCYESSHQPFQESGPSSIKDVNSRSTPAKIIRGALRAGKFDPRDAIMHSIHRCACSKEGTSFELDDFERELDPDITLEDLGIGEGETLFIRRRETKIECREPKEFGKFWLSFESPII